MDDSDDSISPATAGALLALCAVIGVVFLVGLWFMNKSADPLYERDTRYLQYVPKNGGNASEMQNTPTLWKDKRNDPPPDAPKPPTQPPPPPVQEIFKMPNGTPPAVPADPAAAPATQP